MVEYAEDLHTLYWNKRYGEFLQVIRDTPVHRLSDELYGRVRTIRDDKRQPEDIRLFASEILGE